MRITVMLTAIFATLMAFAQVDGTRLDVTSKQDGVTVIIDGRDRGPTPLSVFDLKPGRHLVKCRLAGYVEREAYVEVEAGRPVSRHVEMLPELGLLLVKSEPEGCNIVIDGVSCGRSPRLITTLETKDPHRVELRKAGYRSSVTEVRFSGRTPVVVNETLVLDSGTIDITSEPAGAEVTVNGIVRGKTPLKVSDIPKGRATVRFRLDGFNEETRELSMNAGDRQALAIVLKGLPGTLSLSTLPPGGRFYVNGEFVGLSPVVMANMKPGEYAVRAEHEGYAAEARTVRIENGTSTSEEFRLSNVMGRLEIRTAPPGAQVVLDGRPVGTTRSNDPTAEFSDILSVENVKEGEHVLTVRKSGFGEVVRHPKVERSKSAQVGVRMQRVFTPDVEVETAAGKYPGILISNTPDFVTIEVKLGVQRSFPRADIRQLRFLDGRK